MTDNMGGIRSVLLIPESNLISIPDVSNNILLGDVQYIAQSANLYVSAWENSSLEIKKVYGSGNQFQHVVSFTLPRGGSDRNNLFAAFDTEKCVCMVTDANDTTFVLGAYDAKCIVIDEFSSGKGGNDLNGYEVKVLLTDRFRAPNTFQYVSEIPDYSISASGIIQITADETLLKIGSVSTRFAHLKVWWRESGRWRFGDISILKDLIYEVAFTEESAEELAASQLAPAAALQSGVLNLILTTTDIDILYYKILTNA